MKALVRMIKTIVKEAGAILRKAMDSTGATVRLIAIVLAMATAFILVLIAMHTLGWTAEDIAVLVGAFSFPTGPQRIILDSVGVFL